MLDLDELCRRLFSATYRDKGDSYDFSVISSRHEEKIKEIVKTWGAEQATEVESSKRIGELEAKVYAYEQIIANSNFKPMLVNNRKTSIGRVDQDF